MIEDLLSELPVSRKIVLELGMGDGKLIKNLSEKEKEFFFIGIEINSDRFRQASLSITRENVKIINNSFDRILPLFRNASINKIIYVLPDPKFIDKNQKQNWEKLYKLIYNKLEQNGIFILITEITNELLQPVEDDFLYEEMSWIKNFFESLGYITLKHYEGYPEKYTTSFLESFSGDKERIRILFFEFTKIIS
jgi:tRNA G46 methylase TrmB